MSHFLLVYISWCPADFVGCLSVRRGPQPDRMRSLLAARVATWTAAVVWGSLAQSVCGRVGLIVAPESGAYTVACIDLRTFQEELPHYIALKTKHMFTLDVATPLVPVGNEKGRS